LGALLACEKQKSRPTCEIPSTDIEYVVAGEYSYPAFSDVDKARECSKKTGRPILLIFTCWGCISNPDLSLKILQDEEVKKLVDNNYLLATLYIDDKTPLNIIDTTKKTWRGEPIKTIGEKHSTFQRNQFQKYFQPFYAIIDHDLNELTPSIGFVPKEEKSKFIDFLKNGNTQ